MFRVARQTKSGIGQLLRKNTIEGCCARKGRCELKRSPRNHRCQSRPGVRAPRTGNLPGLEQCERRGPALRQRKRNLRFTPGERRRTKRYNRRREVRHRHKFHWRRPIQPELPKDYSARFKNPIPRLGRRKSEAVGGSGVSGNIDQFRGVCNQNVFKTPADGWSDLRIVCAAGIIVIETNRRDLSGATGEGNSVRRKSRLSRAAGACLSEQVHPRLAAISGTLHARNFVGRGVAKQAVETQGGVCGGKQNFRKIEQLRRRVCMSQMKTLGGSARRIGDDRIDWRRCYREIRQCVLGAVCQIAIGRLRCDPLISGRVRVGRKGAGIRIIFFDRRAVRAADKCGNKVRSRRRRIKNRDVVTETLQTTNSFRRY